MKHFFLSLWFLPCLAFGQIERETHLANIKQLTFGGLNAEAYFSADGKNSSTSRRKGDIRATGFLR